MVGMDQVVAEGQGAGLACQPVAADQEGLGDAVGPGLNGILEADAEALSRRPAGGGTAAGPRAWRSA